MRILITGAKGFVGKNLVAALKNLQEGKDRTRPELKIDEIFAYDLDSSGDLLREACQKADFVFHLAGVNRPKDPAAFMQGNLGFTERLLEELKAVGNNCPVMISSSVQASLLGRYADSEYGRSKLAGEEALFSYGRETGAKVLVYRFPNLFGKWCRPDYNSVVATFCHHMANDLPITVSDPSAWLELVYIDDLIDSSRRWKISPIAATMMGSLPCPILREDIAMSPFPIRSPCKRSFPIWKPLCPSRKLC